MIALLKAETAQAWRALIALSALFFLITAGTFTSLGVVLPDMISSLGWTWADAGLGFTLMGVACGLASVAPAVMIRLLGVRAALVLGGLVSAAGFACLNQATGVGLYWLGAILAGVGFALVAIIPGTYVLARRFTNRSAAIGLYFTLGSLGGVAGPWLYFAAKAAGDWRAYWLALGLAVLALAALAALAVGRDPEPVAEAAQAAAPGVFQAPRDWNVREALATPQFWIVTAAYTVYLLCETTVNAVSTSHLIDRGIDARIAGGMLSLQALVNACARAAGGLLSERVEPKRIVMFALGAVALGLAALTVATGYPAMITFALGVGLGYGLSSLAATVLLLNYFGRARNLELFSMMCLVSTLAAAGPWLAGFSRDRLGGFEPAFWLFAALALAVLGAVALMRPPEKSAR